MPLSAAKPSLKAAIEAAFEGIKSGGENNSQLAADLANAIHDYTTQAMVDITAVISTVPPGQVTISAGVGGSIPGPVATVGATMTPGVAAHAGFGTINN